MSEPISINRFVKGVNTDIAEDTLPEGFLSGGHNIKLSNHDNKQGIIQKQEGYIKKLNGYGINLKPLAAKVFNNIIYIVSYNISNYQTEYGTYPSADLDDRTGVSGKEIAQKVRVYAPLPNFKSESIATANPANIYYVNHLGTPVVTSTITVNDGSDWIWVSDSGDFDVVTPHGGASESTISMHHSDNYTNESIKREVVVRSVNGTIPTTITVIQRWGAWVKAEPNIFNGILAIDPDDVYTEVTASSEGAPPVVQSKSAELEFIDFDPSTRMMTIGIDNNSGAPRQLNMVLATSGDEIETTTILFNQLEDTIETNTSSIIVTAAGGSNIALCTVTATSAWTASINHASVTSVNPPTGNAGNTVVTVNIGTGTANGVTGNIIFTSNGSGKTATTTIIQQADFMTIDPTSVTISDLAGSTFATQAQAGSSWITAINHPNITTIAPAAGSTLLANVWITADANLTASEVTGYITFTSGTGKVATLNVTQEATSDFMTLVPDQVIIPALGGNTFATQAQAMISWSTVIGTPSNVTLISPSTGGTSLYDVWITATTNNASNTVTSNVVFTSSTGVVNTLTVIQEKAPDISFSPASVNIGEYAQTGVVVGTLISEDDWALGAIPSWITPSQTSGSATAGLQITCDVTANVDDVNSRTGVFNFNLVNFTGSASGSVIQAVSTESISIDTTLINLGPTGLIVASNLGNVTSTSAWTILQDYSILTAVTPTVWAGNDIKLVTYKHTQNTTNTNRSEAITIELDSNGATAVVAIDQDPYAIVINGGSDIPFNGGNFDVTIVANGSWSVDETSTDALLTPSQLSGGSGTTVMTVAIDNNDSASPRSMDFVVEINVITTPNLTTDTQILTQLGQ